MITQDELKATFIYDEHTGDFTRIMAHGRLKPAGTINTIGYKVIGFKSKLWLAHRLAWLYLYGCLPDCDIDHIDENKSNNAICNLRIATRSQNNQNRRFHNKNNRHKAIGVSQNHIGKYVAGITINKKTIHLGCFDTIEAASEAYQKAKIELHPFAPNVITSRKQPF